MGAQPQENAVGSPVVQYVVYLSAFGLLREVKGKAGDPFPIAVMGQKEGYAQASAQKVRDLFKILETHPALHLLRAHMPHLHRLEKIISQKSVKFLSDALDFLSALFGK